MNTFKIKLLLYFVVAENKEKYYNLRTVRQSLTWSKDSVANRSNNVTSVLNFIFKFQHVVIGRVIFMNYS